MNKIGVIGAGTMGNGIAHVSALSGFETVLMDIKDEFVDCGLEKVLTNTIRNIWPRIVNNGILILDHYNDDCAPSESDVLDSVIGKNVIQQMTFVRQPTAFVIKKYK